MSNQNKKSFWITNLTKKDLRLGDLGISIKARSSINLLGNYKLKPEQIYNSVINGSIARKVEIHQLSIRKIPPIEFKNHIQVDLSNFIPDRAKVLVDHKTVEYEELKVIDQDKEEQKIDEYKFAAEEADLLDSDINMPVIEKVSK